jgi:hypothetical protein
MLGMPAWWTILQSYHGLPAAVIAWWTATRDGAPAVQDAGHRGTPSSPWLAAGYVQNFRQAA